MRGRRAGVGVGAAVAFALTFAFAVVACSRRPADDTAPAPASAQAPAPASAPAPAPASAPAPAPASAPAPAPASAQAPASDGAFALDGPTGTAPEGEARRMTLARLEGDPLLALHLATLHDHFGSGARGPFETQRVDLAGGRTAFLVARADDSDPFVLAVDRDQLLWTKPRPVLGIVGPVRHLTLAARPDGGAGLFAWVASLHLVAARMWADDGNAFGDFELFSPATCDALSVAYAPRTGWVIVCTSGAPRGAGAGASGEVAGGATRAQRLREDGTVAWSRDGVALGSASATGPATIAFDTPSTFVLVAPVVGVGGDHVLAYRYDADGEPLWATPVDLGALPGLPAGAAGASPSGAPAHLAASVVRAGVVRVELPRGLAGKSGPRVAELRSSGDVTISRP